MAMASSSSSCSSWCFPSSRGHGFTRRSLITTTPTRSIIRLITPPASPRAARLLFSVSCAPDPPLDLAADEQEQDEDERYGFQIQVSKMGKRNRRVVRARVRVNAPLEAVWATLTDYEGLADFIPGLSECRLVHRDHRFARLYQVIPDSSSSSNTNKQGLLPCSL